MPASNRECWACGYMRPAHSGEHSRIGRGVEVWLCRDCAKDPAAGWAKRQAAQAKQSKRD